MDHHVLHVAREHRVSVLVDLTSAPGRTVVFTRTKHGAKALTRQLNSSGVPTVELHGNLSQNARTRNMEAFHSGKATTLVATDIAARGIHVDDVALVVHADPPVEHKAYLHRSGRTARAGAKGTVITLMTDDQVRDVRDLTRAAGIKPTITKINGASHPLLAELAPGERVLVPGGLVVDGSDRRSAARRRRWRRWPSLRRRRSAVGRRSGGRRRRSGGQPTLRRPGQVRLGASPRRWRRASSQPASRLRRAVVVGRSRPQRGVVQLRPPLIRTPWIDVVRLTGCANAASLWDSRPRGTDRRCRRRAAPAPARHGRLRGARHGRCSGSRSGSSPAALVLPVRPRARRGVGGRRVRQPARCPLGEPRPVAAARCSSGLALAGVFVLGALARARAAGPRRPGRRPSRRTPTSGSGPLLVAGHARHRRRRGAVLPRRGLRRRPAAPGRRHDASSTPSSPLATGNVVLVFAAVLLGLVVGLERRAVGRRPRAGDHPRAPGR